MTACDSDRGGPPAVASAEGILRGALSEALAASDVLQRFLLGLEEVLDPVVAVLDALPAMLDPALAPDDVLGLLAAWLGVEFDERMAVEIRRRLVAHATELARWQGTRRGLELALRLHFPDLPIEVADTAHVAYALDRADLPPVAASEVIVTCQVPLDDTHAAEMERAIEAFAPAHVPYRLRIRSRRDRERLPDPDAGQAPP